MLKDLAREQELTIGKVNISEISRMTGFDRKTVRHYLSSDVPPESRRRRNRPSKLDKYKPYIRNRLEQYPSLTRTRIYEEIKEQGYDGGLTILGDYISKVRPEIPRLPEIRYETPPGDMGQCDWFEYNYACTDGTKKKVYGFIMVLGYSRMRYVRFFHSQSLQALIEGHLGAFEYFNGVPKVLLYDNLRSVVLKRKVPSTSSEFHPEFINFRDHFGFTSRLCRIYRAKTKGKVERGVLYVKQNFLYGREFSSIDDLNLQVMGWLNTANAKVHGTTYEIPFERLPKENFRPYSSYPQFVFKKKYQRKVMRDCYISMHNNQYSVPWQYAGRIVDVFIQDNTMSVFADDAEICTHVLLEGKNQRSKKKEHFEGLLKKVLNEPCKNPKRKQDDTEEKEQYLVEKRSTADYDALFKGDDS